jgi:SAM-dependent methyltransferase
VNFLRAPGRISERWLRPRDAEPQETATVEESTTPRLAGPELLTLERFRDRYGNGELSLEHWDQFAIDPAGLGDRVDDPHSADYARWVMASWSGMSGRDAYEPTLDESFDLDDSDYLAFPYPFSSRDPGSIAGYLGAVAHAITLIGDRPPARVVEFGSGWGHLAMTLAASGFDVTAVDLNTASVDLLRRRAGALGVPLNVEHAGFLDFEPGDPYDCVVFFEAFHHCHRPFELLDRCTAMLRPGGTLLFVAEAFYDGFYAPWGVRLDGSAAFMTAQQGWLELGFSRAFIESDLADRGYTTSWTVLDHLGPYGTFMAARLTAIDN